MQICLWRQFSSCISGRLGRETTNWRDPLNSSPPSESTNNQCIQCINNQYIQWINKQPIYPVYQQTSKQVMSFPGTSSLSFDIKIVCAPICFFFLETNSWAIQTQICAHPDPCVCQLGERRLSSATTAAQSDVGALFKHPPSDCDTDMADCWLLFTNV